MIQITHLTKVYRSKKKKSNKALDDICLTLPHTGLVFVLGKSGSGKSTLLNLLGGLDKVTSGKIDVDGNIVSGFREKSLCDYRNSHIGFIFQDYHLIDELTVFENIRLSLNLLGMEQDEAVLDALEKVGLAGYESRFPTELSGGERQRVAIARAIVKKPRIILADEPTGNLDNKTATQIIDILKRLSQQCLIVTVSHNTTDAYIYADRIIELAKGKIIADHTRNPQFSDGVRIEGDAVIYPQRTYLSDEDIACIDQGLSVGALRRIIKRTDKFIPTELPEEEKKKEKIRHAGLGFGRFLKLSLRFLKNKAGAIALSSFMVAVIMVIMALAQTIIAFDAGQIIAGEMSKSHVQTLYMVKTTDEETARRLDKSYRVAVDDGDIQTFYDNGYKGKIYPVVNLSVPILEYRNSAGVGLNYFSGGYYISESFGTIIADEAFLQKRFGQVQYLAKAGYQDPAGVVITDYLADAILKQNGAYVGQTYADILGKYGIAWWPYDTMVINGILDTGYKTRHAQILEKIDNGEFRNTSEMYADEGYVALSNEIYESLGFSYALNPDFVQAYQDTPMISAHVSRQKVMVNDVLELGADNGDRYYFCRGESSGEKIEGWRYTQTVPRVPGDAKYIRVSFGTTDAMQKNEVFAQLPVAEKMCAHVVFSNGQIAEPSELNVKVSTVLDPKTGEEVALTGYSTTYLSDYIAIPEGCTISEFCTLDMGAYAYCAFYDENKNCIGTYTPKDKEPIADGTVVMNYHQYNSIFGTNYNEKTLDAFQPHTVTLTQYRLYDVDCENPLFTVEVTVAGLAGDEWRLADDVSKLFEQQHIYTNALYFDGTEGIGAVTDTAQTLHYEYQSFAVEGIHTMTKAVDVFVPIFRLVAVILCVGVVFILVNFGTKLIRDKMHEIGILKALGAKNSAVGAVFGLQVVCIALLTCLLSTIGYYLFIDVANDVLMESLLRLAPSHVVLDLDFLTFKPAIAAVNCGLVAILSAVALIVPILKVRKIEPVKIIRTRE